MYLVQILKSLGLVLVIAVNRRKWVLMYFINVLENEMLWFINVLECTLDMLVQSCECCFEKYWTLNMLVQRGFGYVLNVKPALYATWNYVKSCLESGSMGYMFDGLNVLRIIKIWLKWLKQDLFNRMFHELFSME